MPIVRTSRYFARLADALLSRFSGKVGKGLDDNIVVYPEPPVSTTQLDADKEIFDKATIKADKGGSLATAQKNVARAVLIDDLNKNASYVDIKCNGDLATLLSSGYDAVDTNRAQNMLNPPQILAVTTPQSGQIKPRIKADPNSKSFVGRIKPIDGEYGPAISFQNSKKILFDGLTAGLVYVFQLMAVGGSTGKSDWSDPGTAMPY